MKNKSIFYCLLLIMLLVLTVFSCPNKISTKEVMLEIKDPITGEIKEIKTSIVQGQTFKDIKDNLVKVEDKTDSKTDTLYKFKGWSTTEQTESVTPELIKDDQKITKDTKLYPVFDEIKLNCVVEFQIYDDNEEKYIFKNRTKVQGGSKLGEIPNNIMPQSEDIKFTHEADGEEYNFVYWAVDPNTSSPITLEREPSPRDRYMPDTVIDKDVVLKAVYKKSKIEYTVKFMVYDLDKKDYVQSGEVQTAEHGDKFSKFTQPSSSSFLQTFTFDNQIYKFIGWTEEKPSSNAPVQDGVVVSDDSKVKNSETVYYAKYTKESTMVNITFKAFNPSTGVYENLDTSISVPGNSRFSDYKTQRFAPEIEYNQTEYMMIGWQEDSSSSILIDKTPIGDEYIISKDTEFYAIYSKDTSLKLTALENNVTVAIWINGTTAESELPQNISLLYKKSGETVYSSYTWGGKTSPDKQTRQGKEIVLNQGEKVYIKGNNNSFSGENAYVFINVYESKKVKASGSVMSLVGDKTSIPSDYCFQKLFANCRGLTTAPVLPATTLKPGCYSSMFEGCIALTEAPALPARNLETSCYYKMFYNCTSLETAPSLLATNLAKNCYYNMFAFCSSLTTVPEKLPATTLADNCYNSMFASCSALTTAPILPAETLTVGCYSNMFQNCTSLTNAPSLPARTLDVGCYLNMFQGCTALETAPSSLPSETLTAACYFGMFANCTSLTNAPSLPARTLTENCYTMMFVNCTSLETAPSLPATTLMDGCYNGLFQGCTSLKTAPSSLPAETLTVGCYSSMFFGCTSLTNAPSLPARTLTENCYYQMFYGCTSLTAAPALPATTLAASCYKEMFKNCSDLRTAPTLSVTQLKESCYYGMFSGCTKLTAAPSLPATTLATSCYQSMFQGCTSLTTAPELKATTLVTECYVNMFNGCSNLAEVKIYANNITTETKGCINMMAVQAKPTGTLYCKQGVNLETITKPAGYIIPTGWTVSATL